MYCKSLNFHSSSLSEFISLALLSFAVTSTSSCIGSPLYTCSLTVIMVDAPLVSNFGTIVHLVHLEWFIFIFISPITLTILFGNSSGRVTFILFYPLSFTLISAAKCLSRLNFVLCSKRTLITHYLKTCSYSCNCTGVTLCQRLLFIFTKISN